MLREKSLCLNIRERNLQSVLQVQVMRKKLSISAQYNRQCQYTDYNGEKHF